MGLAKNIRRDLQKRNMKSLLRNGAFQFTPTFFPYTSGEIGPYYVQCADIQKNVADYNGACNDLRNLVVSSVDAQERAVVSGGESRDWMFSFRVAQMTWSPHAMIYKNGKIFGANMAGEKVVHVADLNNEGSSPRDMWVPAIKKAGGKIKHIFFYVDRLESGVQVMQDLGLESHAVVPLNHDAWNDVLNSGEIDVAIYQNLIDRMRDKDIWAKDMLRSEKGLERLAELFRSPDKATIEKARKIVQVGYPHLTEELTEEMVTKGVPRTILEY